MINARNLRRLRFVPRWVVIPHNHRQNVAEHSFHVAWIVLWLRQHLNVEVTMDVLLDALAHDSDEAVSGDLPTTYKRGDIGEASASKCVVKIADILEAFLFAKEEMAFGNTAMIMVIGGLVEKGEKWCDRLRVVLMRDVPHFHELGNWLWSEVDPLYHPNSHPLPTSLKPMSPEEFEARHLGKF